MVTTLGPRAQGAVGRPPGPRKPRLPNFVRQRCGGAPTSRPLLRLLCSGPGDTLGPRGCDSGPLGRECRGRTPSPYCCLVNFWYPGSQGAAQVALVSLSLGGGGRLSTLCPIYAMPIGPMAPDPCYQFLLLGPAEARVARPRRQAGFPRHINVLYPANGMG